MYLSERNAKFEGGEVEKLKVLSLFAGIGGFDLGLERTGGFETVAFCEIDPFCQRVLAKHWPGVPCYDDVRTLTAERLSADGIAVDVICGGFPCQDLAVCGRGSGLTGERSGLWFEFARLIRELRPRYVIVENSPEMLAGWLGIVLGALAACGYDAEWDCIPAASLGAPHRRERFWLVAYASGDGFSGPRRFPDALCATPDAFGEANWLVDAFQGDAMPYVCRRHDGRSRQLDHARNRTLGNAVAPQIPELIGRAILDCARERS
jgi:DNA (cytosine-5)-methyltransferase 1